MNEITVSNLKADYNSRNVLNGVSFVVTPGELVALCGRNGSGKSTLLSVMAAVPDAALKVEGSVLLDGVPVGNYKRKILATKIAYMEQSEFSTWNFPVKDYVLQGRFAHSKNGYYSVKDYEIVETVMAEMQISEFADRTVHALSGGEFQKVRIARALAQEPEFMLLDEPASGLDFVYEPQLMEQLKKITAQKGIGIILSIHNINTAAHYCDKMILLPAQAAVISGTPEQVMNEENLKLTFGVDFERTDGRQLFQPRGTK